LYVTNAVVPVVQSVLVKQQYKQQIYGITISIVICKDVNLLLMIMPVVALKTLDILQGSVATHLRCGGIFSDSIIVNFLLILIVK